MTRWKNILVVVLAFECTHYVQLQLDTTPCLNRLCYILGTCNFQQGICRCLKGYVGFNCTDINECRRGHVDPCGHRGVCNNTLGGFECQCLSGWTGQRCETQTSENFTCLAGYYGDKCSETICGHGYPEVPSWTSTVVNSTICVCDEGWTKSKIDAPCNVDIDECMQTPSLCLNGGTCRNTDGSYHCECTGLWKGINCSDYVTTSTEAKATSQSTVKFTQQSATTQQLTTHDHRELGSTVFYTTDKNDQKTPESVEQNITEYAHLKESEAISTEQTIITLPLQTAQVAKQDTTHTITEMSTTVLYVKDPTNRNTLDDRYLTTPDHPETSSTELLSTHTGHSNYTTADYSPSVTDPVFKEAQRKPFLSNLTTLELTTGLSLTRLLPDHENEEGGREQLTVWMIALISMGGILAFVLLSVFIVLKYYTVTNNMCSLCKRMFNKVDASLA